MLKLGRLLVIPVVVLFRILGRCSDRAIICTFEYASATAKVTLMYWEKI